MMKSSGLELFVVNSSKVLLGKMAYLGEEQKEKSRVQSTSKKVVILTKK